MFFGKCTGAPFDVSSPFEFCFILSFQGISSCLSWFLPGFPQRLPFRCALAVSVRIAPAQSRRFRLMNSMS